MVRKVTETLTLMLWAGAVSWPLGYAAGRFVNGGPEAAQWLQAASALCVLILAAVQVWATLRRAGTRADGA